jgi:hypothetical protein
MNWIEGLGYLATVVTLVSMVVKDMITLRVVNGSACILWIGYGLVKGDTPILLVNGIILGIHIIALIRRGYES